ncbi:hypothetical protein HDU93_004533 [Gonapodya sp. JEL0774]|nr:hypothetical protein HDU93_004533 [Gonapodya sp. JEL0774]
MDETRTNGLADGVVVVRDFAGMDEEAVEIAAPEHVRGKVPIDGYSTQRSQHGETMPAFEHHLVSVKNANISQSRVAPHVIASAPLGTLPRGAAAALPPPTVLPNPQGSIARAFKAYSAGDLTTLAAYPSPPPSGATQTQTPPQSLFSSFSRSARPRAGTGGLSPHSTLASTPSHASKPPFANAMAAAAAALFQIQPQASNSVSLASASSPADVANQGLQPRAPPKSKSAGNMARLSPSHSADALTLMARTHTAERPPTATSATTAPQSSSSRRSWWFDPLSRIGLPSRKNSPATTSLADATTSPPALPLQTDLKSKSPTLLHGVENISPSDNATREVPPYSNHSLPRPPVPPKDSVATPKAPITPSQIRPSLPLSLSVPDKDLPPLPSQSVPQRQVVIPDSPETVFEHSSERRVVENDEMGKLGMDSSEKSCCGGHSE